MSQSPGLRSLRAQLRTAQSWQQSLRSQRSRCLSTNTRPQVIARASVTREQHIVYSSKFVATLSSRYFNTSMTLRNPSESAASNPEPAPLTNEAYHEYADAYLETVLNQLEELGETKLDLDVEYSAGVLNCVFPPNGTYVLNKQPPNKQIWLSSPVSGPKRYDYVLPSSSGSVPEAAGEWMYLRDGSKLTDLLREELGVEIVPGAED